MASAVRFFVVFSSACGYIFTNKVDKTTMKLKDDLSTLESDDLQKNGQIIMKY